MKKTNFSRRLFVKGTGATLALPLMESLIGTKAFSQVTRHRFAFIVRAGNGIVQQGEGPDQFWPRTTGAITQADMLNLNADRATTELAAYASKLTLVKNVKLPFARNACGHSEAIVQLLTAQNHTGGAGNLPKPNGRSVDWLIAEKLNAAGVGPLCFMAGPTGAYIQESMSWSASQTRTSAEHNPLSTYMRLVGLSNAPPAVQQLIATRRKSVNDLVRAELTALKNRSELSANDKMRLDRHLTSVRDMEIRMTCDLDPTLVTAVRGITGPEGNDVRPEVVKRFMDLAAWAFNCRLNHVGTLQVGEGNDQTSYLIPGVNGGNRLPKFHWISHRIQGDGDMGAPIPNAIELHHQVDRFQLRMFKYFLDQLNSYASAYGGTLLDDTAAIWTNDLGSGVGHSADNIPMIFAGGAGGTLNTGRVIDLQKANVNLVLNTLVNAMGIKNPDGSTFDSFGSSTLAKGVVSGMLV
jgi:hypothetical protein